MYNKLLFSEELTAEYWYWPFIYIYPNQCRIQTREIVISQQDLKCFKDVRLVLIINF